MNIQEGVSLKELTTFRIGGPAAFFVVVKTIDELKDAVAFAQQKNVEIFVLGGGSNVLISDAGFSGLVIKNEIKGIEEVELDGTVTEIISGAGEVWDELVAYVVERNLFGLENLSLIPGSVGAAPVQNIGAYGVEVKETIKWVEALNTETGKIETINNGDCLFSYRDSLFKKQKGKKYIITRVCFALSKKLKLKTDYKDVAKYLIEHADSYKELTLQNVRDIVIDIRKNKLPDVNVVGTAGSFFKNPIISVQDFEKIKASYPDIVGYQTADQKIKVSAAWIIDHICGMKGYQEGNVGTYKTQALALVNVGGATQSEVLNLAEKIIAATKEKTGIMLEKEVQIIF